MNDPTDTSETSFRTALRERVADEHPDYARLSAGAISAGTRIRRRRRVAVTVAAAAAVGAFAAGGLVLSQVLTPVAQEETPIASGGPSTAAPALTVGQVIEFDNGATGRVVPASKAETVEITVLATSHRSGTGTGFIILLQGAPELIEPVWSEGALLEKYPGVTLGVEGQPPGPLTAPVEAPAGWECEWYLADEKASCTAEDGGVAGLVIRPEEDYAEWSAMPDAHLTEVHGGIFVSVQGGRGTTDAELADLARSLTWVS